MSAVRHLHPVETEDRLLSAEDAADMLGISAYTVRQRARDGTIPAMRLGRLWRFRRSDLDHWIAENIRVAR